MSITKEGDKWRCQLYFFDFKGQRHKTGKRGFKTKKEAKEWGEAFLEENNLRVMLFRDLVKIYLEDQKNRVCKSTMHGKIYIINTKILPYFEKRELRSITKWDIRNWQNELLKGDYSPTYLRTVDNHLGRIFNFAEKYYDLGYNPWREVERIGKSYSTRLKFWKVEEFDRFIEKIKDKPDACMAFKILFWTGIRIGELLALTIKDIDLEKRTVLITKSLNRLHGNVIINNPKTESGRRTVTIPVFLAEEIKEYYGRLYGKMNNDLIFTFSKSYLEHQMKRGCELSGMEKIRIHDLRHSHASTLVNNGVTLFELQNRLGHARIRTTIDTYCHLYPEKNGELATKLDEIRENENKKKTV